MDMDSVLVRERAHGRCCGSHFLCLLSLKIHRPQHPIFILSLFHFTPFSFSSSSLPVARSFPSSSSCKCCKQAFLTSIFFMQVKVSSSFQCLIFEYIKHGSSSEHQSVTDITVEEKSGWILIYCYIKQKIKPLF